MHFPSINRIFRKTRLPAAIIQIFIYVSFGSAFAAIPRKTPLTDVEPTHLKPVLLEDNNISFSANAKTENGKSIDTRAEFRNIESDSIDLTGAEFKKGPQLLGHTVAFSKEHETKPVFDVPVTYNARIRFWINYFQTTGRKWFKIWLERSFQYIPEAQKRLAAHGMPKDLAYLAMIESGFSSSAASTAGAVGYWQFIAPTATRYGLRVDWWMDERQNFGKSTEAAIRYLKDLHRIFGSWYLVAAGYNTGETRVKRVIEKHRTRDFWKLAEMGALSDETINYVPKMIAAMLIAKTPGLYGFTGLARNKHKEFEVVNVPGGVDLFSIAEKLEMDQAELQDLNPELLKGIIPPDVRRFMLKIPPGKAKQLNHYLRSLASSR